MMKLFSNRRQPMHFYASTGAQLGQLERPYAAKSGSRAGTGSSVDHRQLGRSPSGVQKVVAQHGGRKGCLPTWESRGIGALLENCRNFGKTWLIHGNWRQSVPPSQK
ncbi:uncharacterized protein LOC142768842 isoform X2 [Rhipicephalus microplus]|uniref:uncharacterized protein LOC142768842 isoform X2 n=1 Tax=Rhipicephalus microplus TaxID=6941 RepID=UPI003F6D7609